ncbi:hypothetical protein HHI36_014959 [Cryptolaemus montrouzieri]|uniref:Uncharacterized protein n=1 Tax=Cryptolaemus montrouzieri TaxID=559131 RepID=A0ABD2N4C1_9CUCU
MSATDLGELSPRAKISSLLSPRAKSALVQVNSSPYRIDLQLLKQALLNNDESMLFEDAGGVIYSSCCPMQKCLRFGLIQKYCRGQYRCHKCGESHEDQTPCDKDPVCNRIATYKQCREHIRQAKIREAMTLYKISFFEANQAYLKPIGPSPSEFPSANESPPLTAPKNAKNKNVICICSQIPKKKYQSFKLTGLNSNRNKRPLPVSPGYDRDAHEDCLLKFAPTFPKKLLVSKSGDELNEQTQLSLQNGRDHGPDVIALNETFLKPEHRLTITNYTLLWSDRQDGYGGIAFAIKMVSLLQYQSSEFGYA